MHSEYPPELAALTPARPDAYRSFPYGPGDDQFGQLWPAAGGTSPAPVVVLVHGGYWRARYRLDLMHAAAADLSGRGYAVWNIEYRRVVARAGAPDATPVGSPSGGWPGTFVDVAAAFDALADLAPEHALDLGRVAAVGHSAGGHLALWACGRHRLAGQPPFTPPWVTPPRVTPRLVVSLAGVADLRMAAALGLSDGAVRGLLGGGPEEVPDRYDLACPTRLLPLGVPQVVLHGTEDVDVPMDLSTHYAKLAGDECELVVLPGVNHRALIDPANPAWADVTRALTRL
ncbi:alpha/beta hydrolase [Rugosimonospora acidiphila]|uniref:Alpha/beta hydrolase n=1 Tax=Rugosimonospora acidiphila TaxID=556531 RepID=A0ABP9SHZ1_9ACTN